jgi:hypothetical protein
VNTTSHVLAFCALAVDLLLGGIFIEETFGPGWRNVFEFLLIGLYLVVAWGVPGSLRPSKDDPPPDDRAGPLP